MPNFTANDTLLETRIAQEALTQLNLMAMYPRVAVVDYEDGAFEVGNDVKIRRPKRRKARSINPRGGVNGTFDEAGFFSGSVGLEHLWFDGWLTYGYDPRQTITKYLTETGRQMADSIATPNDEYMNSLFTGWTATAGNVALGAHPPIGIAACVDANGQITKFNSDGLTGASVVLNKENVPNEDRFALISPTATGAFLQDAIAITGFAAATIGGGQIIQEGVRGIVPRFGFGVGSSNIITSQSAVTDLDTAANSQATLAIASVSANTNFTYADYTANTTVGAVNLTLTCATALSNNVAVGQIARIGTNTRATAFGVIIRIDRTTPTAPVVTLVPFAPNGTKLGVGDITSGTDVFSIPSIPSINTVNHREGLLMATRRIAEPSPGSGAVAASITDPDSNLTIQVFRGNYDTGTVSEKNAYYMLTGSKISDFRKTALILSL